MRRFYTAMSAAAALILVAAPGWAQDQGKTADPNLGHFFMGRQQVQLIDDAPLVNDMRTQPAPPGDKAAAAALNRPRPLPRAGFMPYSNNLPSVQSSLPRTANGVPPKAPPPSAVNPKSGKAGAYKGQKPSAATASAGGPPVLRTYAPVKGYGSGNSVAPVSSAPSTGPSSSTAVRGSLLNQSGSSALHWSRTRPN